MSGKEPNSSEFLLFVEQTVFSYWCLLHKDCQMDTTKIGWKLTNSILIPIHIPYYNFPLPPPLLHPLNVLPPSSSKTFPVICALALLLKNNTTPAKSLAFPIRPLGCRSKSVSIYFSTPKLVIREGKTPGQIQFTIMFSGTSFEAMILVR